MYSPYADTAGYASSGSITSKQLRHVTSLQEVGGACRTGPDKLQQSSALTRSQVAEQKHIRRQSSISDTHSNQARPMSAERSRPSSASLCSDRKSLSRESLIGASQRLSSTDRFGGSGHGHSRSASPGHHSQTIAAYNPSLGRSTLTNLNSSSNMPSRGTPHTLQGSGSFPLTDHDAAHRRLSTGMSTGRHSHSTQALDISGRQASANMQSDSSAKRDGLQSFLTTLEKMKEGTGGSSLHSQPKRSNSGSRSIIELSGQFMSNSMATIGDRMRR